MNTSTHKDDQLSMWHELLHQLIILNPRDVLWDVQPFEHSSGVPVTLELVGVQPADMMPVRVYNALGDKPAYECSAVIERTADHRVDMTFWVPCGTFVPCARVQK